MLGTFAQYGDLGLLILSLVLAAIFIYHGWPKLTKPEGMAAAMGWPAASVRVLGAVEIMGALGIALGVHVQLSALALSLVMVGAIYTKIAKWHIPFQASNNTGWEFDLILLAVNIFLLTNAG